MARLGRVLAVLGLADALPSSRAELKADHFQILQPPQEDNTSCGLGDPYRFLVRTPPQGPNVKELALEFFGGGGCWNLTTCNASTTGWGGQEAKKFWMTRTGLDELQSLLGAELQGCAVPGFGRGLWDFCKEEHPFRTWQWVALPYCTGDQHLGNNVARYPDGEGGFLEVQHVGARNADSVLRWVQSLFPDLERIYVTGESAGGWASFAWTAEIARRFPNAQVTGWADSSLHLLCPSSECDEALKTVSETWGAPNEFTEGGLWTTEALQPGWGLPEFLADTLKSFKGRVRFGIFTRTADEEQLLFWDLFGGLKDKWTEGLVSLLHSFERDASPALLRTFVSPGATHGIHRSEEVWTLQVQGIRFVEWLRDLGGCQAHAARVWDPAVGVAASYAAENASEAAAYSCAAPTTTPVPGDSSASSGAFPLMPLVALLVSCV